MDIVTSRKQNSCEIMDTKMQCIEYWYCWTNFLSIVNVDHYFHVFKEQFLPFILSMNVNFEEIFFYRMGLDCIQQLQY